MFKLKIPKGRHQLLVAFVAFVMVVAVCGTTSHRLNWPHRTSNSISAEHFPKPQNPTIVKSDNWRPPPTPAECEKHFLDKTPARFNLAKKIAFISRDPTATLDFIFMAESLQLERVDYYNPTPWFSDTGRRDHYKAILNDGTLEKICSTYELVFVAGSIPDGWGLIMEEGPLCGNVVFLVSQRIDADLDDDQRSGFLADLNWAVSREDRFKAHVVANNNYDVAYMRKMGIKLTLDIFTLIRPLGHSAGRGSHLSAKESVCLLAGSHADNDLMGRLISENTDYECTAVDRHAGARTLSMYNAPVVFLPAKMTNLVLWENLMYGVVVLVPTPRFLVEILDKNNYNGAGDIVEAKEFLEAGWELYNDAYMPHWEYCFRRFDSWNELRAMILNRDRAPIINQCRDKMLEHRVENLKDWKKFLMTH